MSTRTQRSRALLALGKGSLALVSTGGGLLGSGIAFAEGGLSYEVREEVTGALLRSHAYDVNGTCATGTDVAPAAVYAQGGSGRGAGLGAGVGGRVGYHYTGSSGSVRGPTWWGFRAGSGLDLNLLYARVDTGIGDMNGRLCARVKSEGAEITYEDSSMLLLQVPGFVGAELGVGTGDDKATWSGIVLGAAWAPTVSYLKPWVSDGDLTASYLGAELTLDFVSLHSGAAHEAEKRVAVFLLLPPQDHGPALLTVSFGVVWY